MAKGEASAALRPPVDVIEDGNGITLLADMPGVTKDKLTLSLDADNLTIEGEVDMGTPPEMESRYAEIKVPRYRRTFTLSRELDPEKAQAQLNNGVLRLHIPKAAHLQPRKIQITAQ
ncbi:Hsp20/alpha crystallin family protein [Oxalobacteraceae bacterium OM1]|nr:Hsp20/alpha crystallin family protein [Oxalobacteraceae bacterium OM1]